MFDVRDLDEFNKILLPAEHLTNKHQLEDIQDVRKFVQMISEKSPERSITILLDHLFSATFERSDATKNLPVAFYNFALFYAWITGKGKNVKLPK